MTIKQIVSELEVHGNIAHKKWLKAFAENNKSKETSMFLDKVCNIDIAITYIMKNYDKK